MALLGGKDRPIRADTSAMTLLLIGLSLAVIAGFYTVLAASAPVMEEPLTLVVVDGNSASERKAA